MLEESRSLWKSFVKWGGDALQFVSLPQDLTLIQLLGLGGGMA